MLFNVFKLTPLSRIATYLLVVLSTIGHFIFILKPKMFSKSIKFWYYIGIVTMLISMTTGYLYYSQSFFAGFVANSNFYNVGSVILCVYLFLKNDISLSRLFSLLIKVSWVNLGLIAFMAITNFAFINESELTGNIVVVHAGKISKNLTNLIAIYWLSLYLFKSNYKYLLFSLLFFAANHFYDLQRVIFLVTLLVIGIGILKMRKFKAARKVVIPALFSIVFVIIFLFNSIQGATIFNKFTEASKVFTEDSDSIDDSSAAVRVYEVGIALNKFKQHPLFGNGYYRASDAEKIMGKDVRFYISDIGFFGILFTLGIFGIFLFFKQLKFVWMQLKIKQINQFQLCLVLSLSFLMISSLLTGKSINVYPYFFLLFTLLQLSIDPIIGIKKLI
jgi:hypothetical protein|tara:strand:- start:4586 stop:5752 length:1167 start_codon:yes stop_codon:yes gene_type:complete